MSKILRKAAIPFASTAAADQVGIFGSLAAGSPATSMDPDLIQSLSNWAEGWFAAILGQNSPAIEDVNAMSFVFAYQLCYLMQNGVPEWNIDTTYYIGSFVASGKFIYVSNTDTNLGNDPTSDIVNWSIVNPITTRGDITIGGLGGAPKRLAIGTVGTTLASDGTDGVWKPGGYSPIKTVTAATYTVLATDGSVLFNPSTSVAVTLPAPAGVSGQVYMLKKVDSSIANVITITPASGLIDGFASQTLNTFGEWVRVQSDGTNYWIIAEGGCEVPVSFTPVFVNLGTVTGISCHWLREGRSPYANVQFEYTMGSIAGSTVTVSLPVGMTVSSVLIPTAPGGSGYSLIGPVAMDSPGAPGNVFIAKGGDIVLHMSAFYPGTYNPLVPNPSGGDLSSTDRISGTIRVPISGWSGA